MNIQEMNRGQLDLMSSTLRHEPFLSSHIPLSGESTPRLFPSLHSSENLCTDLSCKRKSHFENSADISVGVNCISCGAGDESLRTVCERTCISTPISSPSSSSLHARDLVYPDDLMEIQILENCLEHNLRCSNRQPLPSPVTEKEEFIWTMNQQATPIRRNDQISWHSESFSVSSTNSPLITSSFDSAFGSQYDILAEAAKRAEMEILMSDISDIRF
ncbi:hypothetical protein V1511DRAFT_511272 [Dipodascopsis uninucleata]